ncbi:MAG: VCBS repeat-containing protein [Planctomycetota bacterium]
MTARTSPIALVLALAVPAATASAQQLFDLPRYVPEAVGGEFRANGDFNNDGHVDLLHMDGVLTWSAMTVLLNDGSGAFTPGPKLDFSGGAGVDFALNQPALGDFDGDGNLDVAIDHSATFGGPEGLEVHFGDGAGGFSGSAFLEFGIGVVNQLAGNIDGDAADEIAVKWTDVDFQSYLVWLDWDGVTFQVSTALPVGGAADPDGAFVEAVGDFDSDGDDDIAATAVDFEFVRVFPTLGGAPVYGPSFPVPASMQNINHRIRAADLDSDGNVDLVHLMMTSFAAGAWVQTYENSGLGLIQRAEELVPTPKIGWVQPHDLRVGDWNGDGWVDLMSNSFSFDVIQSDGDWTFSEGFEVTSTGQAPGGGPADYDGDGNLDYAATQTLHIGDGTFDSSELEDGWFTYFPGDVVADFEGDGDLDHLGGASGQRDINDASGAFLYDSGELFTGLLPPPPAGGFQWGQASAIGDFDGDGRLDYLMELDFNFGTSVGFIEMRVLRVNGAGELEDLGLAALPLEQIAPPSFNNYWMTADADSDGDIDVLAAGGYWRNTGGAFFDQKENVYVGVGQDAKDTDGDGDNDLLVARDVGLTTDIVVYENDEGTFVETVIGNVAGNVEAVYVDLDDDGDYDVAAADPLGIELHLFENAGGTFASAVVLAAEVPDLRLLGVQDVDDDGLSDLLTLDEANDPLGFSIPLFAVWKRTSGLTYEALTQYHQTGDFRGFADVDSDGDLDGIGRDLARGQLVPAPCGGTLRQFGQGFPGTGGVEPLVGALGPATSTNPDGELRIVRGVGGGLAILIFSGEEVLVPDTPFTGMTLYVGNPTILSPVTLSGAPGVAGEGSFAFSLPTLPAIFGLAFTHQVFVLDPGSVTGWSSSGAFEIVYGK